MSEAARYSMVIEWSSADGLYIVSFPEWGDLAHTHGATFQEAVRNGQEVLELLIEGARQEGRSLPEPRDYNAPESMEGYSGRFVVRIPPSLHRDLVRAAAEEGVSLNQLAAVALARAVGYPKDELARAQRS
jgi:antitoxin HicB